MNHLVWNGRGGETQNKKRQVIVERKKKEERKKNIKTETLEGYKPLGNHFL